MRSAGPDVVLILTDEERAPPPYETEDLAAWRSEVLVGRQWFIANGIDFRRHYVAATACVPSRPSLLTGQFPDLHGVTQTDGLGKRSDDSRLRWLPVGEVPTIGHWFRAAGYDTHYDGKWHVSRADLMVDGEPLATNTSHGEVISENVERYLEADPLDPYGFSGWVGPEPHGGQLANAGVRRDQLAADRITAWLEERYRARRAGDRGAMRPFLLVASFVNPHDIVLWPLWAHRGLPFDVRPHGPPTTAPAPTASEDLAAKPAAQAAFRAGYPTAYGMTEFVEEAYRRDAEYRDLYLRLHQEVDGPIDQVRRAVTDGGSDDAVLVFTSDHGDLLGAHGGLHQKWFNLYDECTRVPLRIARIGSDATTAGVVDEAITSHVDLLPTLTSIAGIDVAATADRLAESHSEVHPLPGRDLAPLVERPDRPGPSIAYVMSRDNILEGDGTASAFARTQGMDDPPFELRIQPPVRVASSFEAVVARLDDAVDGLGHVWKLVRTHDDPATWTEPHVRQLAARTPDGDEYRSEPLADEWELYDLDSDPIEAVNCWTDPVTASVRAHLLRLLESERARCIPPRDRALRSD